MSSGEDVAVWQHVAEDDCGGARIDAAAVHEGYMVEHEGGADDGGRGHGDEKEPEGAGTDCFVQLRCAGKLGSEKALLAVNSTPAVARKYSSYLGSVEFVESTDLSSFEPVSEGVFDSVEFRLSSELRVARDGSPCCASWMEFGKRKRAGVTFGVSPQRTLWLIENICTCFIKRAMAAWGSGGWSC